MSDLVALLINEIIKPLKQIQRIGVGCIDNEKTGEVYYRIDDRYFRIKVEEVDSMGNPLE